MVSVEGPLPNSPRVPLAQVAQGLSSERVALAPVGVFPVLLESNLLVPVEGMFFTDGDLLLDVVSNSGADYLTLGLSDSIGGSRYLFSPSGEVLILDVDEQQLKFVNASLDAFLVFMKRWDEFVSMGSIDEEEGVKLGRKLKRELKKIDKRAFKDEEFWWACVFEDVEYGVLGPS